MNKAMNTKQAEEKASAKPIKPPRAENANLVRATHNGAGPVSWIHQTDYSFEDVLSDGYFDLVAGALERHDRIAVTAGASGSEATYADLVVVKARHGDAVEVVVLGKPETVSLPASTWWEILGVTKTSTFNEIREAYRKKVFQAHPDQGGSDQAMMKVQNAWELARDFHEGKSAA